jgi:hypothetical protein
MSRKIVKCMVFEIDHDKENVFETVGYDYKTYKNVIGRLNMLLEKVKDCKIERDTGHLFEAILDEDSQGDLIKYLAYDAILQRIEKGKK